MAPLSSTRRLLLNSLEQLAKDQTHAHSFLPWHRLPPSRLLTYTYLTLLAFRFLFLTLALSNPLRYQWYFILDPTMSLAASLLSYQSIIALALVPAATQLGFELSTFATWCWDETRPNDLAKRKVCCTTQSRRLDEAAL